MQLENCVFDSEDVEDKIIFQSTKEATEMQISGVFRKDQFESLDYKDQSFCQMLSPISEMAVNFSGFHMDIDGTPVTRHKAKVNYRKRSYSRSAQRNDGNITWPYHKVKCEKKEDESNMFNMTDMLGDHRRRISVEAASSSLSNMNIDDLSFYGEEQRQCIFPSPPSNGGALLSPEGSPFRFQIVKNRKSLSKSHQKHKILSLSGKQQQFGNENDYGDTPCSSGRALATSRFAQRNSSNKKVYNLTPGKSFRVFNSLSSGSGSIASSMEDEYMELLEMESIDEPHCFLEDEETHLPSNLNTLISGQINQQSVVKSPTYTSYSEPRRPSVRRCLSLLENNQHQKRRECLSSLEPKTPELLKSVQRNFSKLTSSSPSSLVCDPISCFKRPDPPSSSASPIQSKRFCSAEKENRNSISNPCSPANSRVTPLRRPIFRQCMSMSDAQIMTALARSDCASEPDLIGDFSRPFCLPLVDGRHCDLKSISSETVAQLINGKFNDRVASYSIIDCRYPYEYEGGHIRGAKNIYTQEQILEELINNKTECKNTAVVNLNSPQRNILIFHCEFSSERGPKLSRFLRNYDREFNNSLYPALNYPEIYLLHNGYKEFFEKHSELCEPIAYLPMLEPLYTEAYKHFRAKSKSWNGDFKGFGGTTNRLKKSRSRLVL